MNGACRIYDIEMRITLTLKFPKTRLRNNNFAISAKVISKILYLLFDFYLIDTECEAGS